MRELDAADGNAPGDFVRAIVLGGIGAGKTHFAASAPAPLFISDAAEGGFRTVKSMDPALWWDPAVTPKAWAIENVFADLPPALAKLEAMKASGDFPFKTIVIDPISIYADRAIAEMHMRASAGGKVVDTRAMYGDLANHLRVLILRIHALPAHVLWLCHVKEGGLELAGSTANKLPAFMDYKWLCTATSTMGNANYELHTQPYGAFSMLGGRTKLRDAKGKMWGLPSPMVPSFKAIAQIMGLGTPASPAMPGMPNGGTYAWPPAEET